VRKESRVNAVRNTTTLDKKTLRTIFTMICEQGYITDAELFSLFDNRRLAIEAARYLTNGKYRILQYEIANGARCYRFSEYYVMKNGISQKVTA